jgi:hypothetical protein
LNAQDTRTDLAERLWLSLLKDSPNAIARCTAAEWNKNLGCTVTIQINQNGTVSPISTTAVPQALQNLARSGFEMRSLEDLRARTVKCEGAQHASRLCLARSRRR